jgi:hypothetical protein
MTHQDDTEPPHYWHESQEEDEECSCEKRCCCEELLRLCFFIYLCWLISNSSGVVDRIANMGMLDLVGWIFIVIFSIHWFWKRLKPRKLED